MMRSHYCGQVTEALLGQEVQLCGWAHRRRDHGGVIFVDLRDRDGLVQVVIDPDTAEAFAAAERVRSEYVLRIRGRVRSRPEGTDNPNLASGKVEVLAKDLEILNRAETPPFQMDDEDISEEVRLRYRYLDLRRPLMQERLKLRARTVSRRVALGGITLGAWPALKAPTVMMASSLGSTSRETMPCSAMTRCDAAQIGSTAWCGRAPCPPTPCTVIVTLSLLVYITPARKPSSPAACPGALWKAYSRSHGKRSSRPSSSMAWKRASMRRCSHARSSGSSEISGGAAALPARGRWNDDSGRPAGPQL